MTSLQAVHEHTDVKNGDTIVLGPGTYSTGGSSSNLLEIIKDITIKAAKAGTVVLDGSNQKRVVHIQASGKVLLEGLNITRGKAVRAHCPGPQDPRRAPTSPRIHALDPCITRWIVC